MHERLKLKFRVLPGNYAVVRLAPDAAIPAWAVEGEFMSITRSLEELSIVCPTSNLPPKIESQYRWIRFKLEGPFPFSLTGVLLSFIQPLSDNSIPIFAISTFDTDYVLIQEDFQTKAISVLKQAGHELLPQS